MDRTPARSGADRPPSTSGTPERRARRWPLPASLLALGAFAVAAPMVAAEPASAPVQPTAVEASPAEPVRATTAEGELSEEDLRRFREAVARNEAAERLRASLERAAAVEAARQEAIRAEAARQEAARQEAARQEAARQEAARQAAAPSGRCGGNLPPCWVMQRESGGNITAKNPTSTASGKWQFINGTWAGYGGYAEAWMAPEHVQDAKAAELWAGGAGCGHWSAC